MLTNQDAGLHPARRELEVVNACLAFTRSTSYDLVRPGGHSDDVRLDIARRCSELMLTLSKRKSVVLAFGDDLSGQLVEWSLTRGKTKGYYCKPYRCRDRETEEFNKDMSISQNRLKR